MLGGLNASETHQSVGMMIPYLASWDYYSPNSNGKNKQCPKAPSRFRVAQFSCQASDHGAPHGLLPPLPRQLRPVVRRQRRGLAGKAPGDPGFGRVHAEEAPEGPGGPGMGGKHGGRMGNMRKSMENLWNMSGISLRMMTWGKIYGKCGRNLWKTYGTRLQLQNVTKCNEVK